MRRLTLFWVVVAVVVLGAATHHGYAQEVGMPEFDEFKVFIEINATDGVGGFRANWMVLPGIWQPS